MVFHHFSYNRIGLKLENKIALIALEVGWFCRWLLRCVPVNDNVASHLFALFFFGVCVFLIKI